MRAPATKQMNVTILCVAMAALVAGCGKKDDPIAKAEKKDADKPGVVAIKDTVKEAYIYGFPMLMNYAVMREYFVDRNSGQYKAPFNTIYNEARVFTSEGHRDRHAEQRYALFLRRVSTCARSPSCCASRRSRRAATTTSSSSTCTPSTTVTSAAARLATTPVAMPSPAPTGREIPPPESRRCSAPRRSSASSATARSSSARRTSTTSGRFRRATRCSRCRSS